MADALTFSFAPMEGITYSAFRRIHHQMFPGCRYYSPFIAPDAEGTFKPRYLREITEDVSEGVPLVPQLLTNNASAFCTVAGKLKELGFDEVNLNVGCPSGTVFSKHKGSALLGEADLLRALLDGIFSSCPLPVSIKTRMGVASTEEFGAILAIYNDYPVKELIIHARDRKGLYKSIPDVAGFARAAAASRNPIVYNGNIFAEADVEKVLAAALGVHSFMVGRGVVADPALIRRLSGGQALCCDELRTWHDALYEYYLSLLSPNFAVDRMKGLWYYMRACFPAEEKLTKRLLKAKGSSEYLSAVQALFASGGFDPSGVKDGGRLFC